MVMLDANVILRYLLNDHEEMASEAEKMIRNHTALVTIEVAAEVLENDYNQDRYSVRCITDNRAEHDVWLFFLQFYI